jgi:hypothetical protein
MDLLCCQVCAATRPIGAWVGVGVGMGVGALRTRPHLHRIKGYSDCASGRELEPPSPPTSEAPVSRSEADPESESGTGGGRDVTQLAPGDTDPDAGGCTTTPPAGAAAPAVPRPASGALPEERVLGTRVSVAPPLAGGSQGFGGAPVPCVAPLGEGPAPVRALACSCDAWLDRASDRSLKSGGVCPCSTMRTTSAKDSWLGPLSGTPVTVTAGGGAALERADLGMSLSAAGPQQHRPAHTHECNGPGGGGDGGGAMRRGGHTP